MRFRSGAYAYVGHVPSWLVLVGLIIVVAGGAVLIQRYVRHRFPVLTGDEHNDVTKFTYGFIGFVYSIKPPSVYPRPPQSIYTREPATDAGGAVVCRYECIRYGLSP